MSVSIQESDFDLAAELNTLRSGNSKVGAMVKPWTAFTLSITLA